MNKQELEALATLSAQPRPTLPEALTDKTPRTLLYGYTCDRATWHVYLDEAGLLHKVVYDHNELMWKHESGVIPDSQLVPDKRLYPEDCDAEACALLIKAGCRLPFTTFTEKTRPPGPFIGKQAEHLVPTRFVSIPVIWGLQAVPSDARGVGDPEKQGFLANLPPDSWDKLQTLLKITVAGPGRTGESMARLGLLLSVAAKEAGVPVSSVGNLPDYAIDSGLYIPRGSESALVDTALGLAQGVAEVQMDVLRTERSRRNEAAERLLRKRLGWSEYGHTFEVTDVLIGGRVAMLRTTGLEHSQLTGGQEAIETLDAAGTALHLVKGKKNGGLQYAFFKQGNDTLVSFTLFGPPLRLDPPAVAAKGTMAVLAA